MANELVISAATRTLRTTNWEAEHDVVIDWTVTPTGAPTVIQCHELFTGRGGWVIWWSDTGNNLLTGGSMFGGAAFTWTQAYTEPNPVYGRFLHVTYDPDGDPALRTRETFNIPVVADDATLFGFERRPPDLADLDPANGSLPDAFPQGDLENGFMISCMGPVEAIDMIVGDDTFHVQRKLIVTGQLINLLNDGAFAAFFADPAANKDARFNIRLRDHGQGRDILDEQLSFRTDWPGFGNTQMMNTLGRIGLFHYSFAIDNTFTSGRMTLEFNFRNISMSYVTEVAYQTADTLHLPIDPWDHLLEDARVTFGNGPEEGNGRSNSHQDDPKQRYAFDMDVHVNGQRDRPFTDGSELAHRFAFGQPLLAVADGRVVRVETGFNDERPGTNSPEPNRVVLEHEHAHGRRYSVYAHCQKDSAEVAVGDNVNAGQTIARVGNNGSSSGPHLHLAYYEVDEWGRMRLLPMAFTVDDGNDGAATGMPESFAVMQGLPGARSNRDLGDQVVDSVTDVLNDVFQMIDDGISAVRRFFGI